MHISAEAISGLMDAVLATDAIFLGVCAAARTLLDRGEVIEIPLTPASELLAQFAFVTLQGRTVSPAVEIVRNFCTLMARAEQ